MRNYGNCIALSNTFQLPFNNATNYRHFYITCSVSLVPDDKLRFLNSKAIIQKQPVRLCRFLEVTEETWPDFGAAQKIHTRPHFFTQFRELQFRELQFREAS